MTLQQEYRTWRRATLFGGGFLGLALVLALMLTRSVPESWYSWLMLGLVFVCPLAGSLLVDILQKCPRCGARLVWAVRPAVGVRRRWRGLTGGGVGDHCRDCGLDLTETRRADFATPEARAAWEARNAARKAEARRGRTFG